jgi:hypothetical protein
MNRHHVIRAIRCFLIAIMACCAEHIHAAEPVSPRASLADLGPAPADAATTIGTPTYVGGQACCVPSTGGGTLEGLRPRPRHATGDERDRPR